MNCEITIPVLNEEKTLVENVLKVLFFLKEKELAGFSICIADNGSTDRTLSLAQELANSYERIRYLSVKEKGVGLALKKSWMTSNAKVVGYMDLDLATDLNHLFEVKDYFFENKDSEILYGSRLAKGGTVVGRKMSREIISRIFNILIRIVFKNTISDSMCGFKFYKKNVVLNIMENGAESDGWFFCAETLIVGQQLNYKMKELPVKWTDDPNSKVKILKLSLEYLKAINKLKRRR